MHDYSSLRINHGMNVPQTVDSPIMIMDFWELQDAFVALFIILVFGVLFSSWFLMMILLSFFLIAGPIIKKNNNKGIYLHWPYKNLKIDLPGLLNPKGKRKFSD